MYSFVNTFYTSCHEVYVSIDNSAELLKEENEEVSETEEEDNFCKPEGLVHFIISDLSKLTTSILSDPTFIRGLPW